MRSKFVDPIRAAARTTLESLELRRLLCADHYIGGIVPTFDPNNPTSIDVIDTRITVKTGSEFAPLAAEGAAQEAAPGMPNLNSRPGAPTAIFLDFDGDSVSATQPYDDDADPATFNASEAAIITNAWQEMSEYFAPFDVNVTTTQPAAGFPTAWVAIGNNISGGYSYVGVFPNSSSGGAKSWNNSSHARTRISGIAHEIGHNFGLNHQSDFNNLGVNVNEYSSGYDLLHGPIIGVDYAQNVHKWYIGHATNSASAIQDDVTVIANRIKTYQPAGGDGMRVDDFANTIASATALTLNGTAQGTQGMIERLSDADAFSFTVGSAANFTHVSAQPHGASGVDLKLSLYNSSGSLMAVGDSKSNAQDLNLTLQPGTYYAVVAGHGNYGDIGWYDLNVNGVPGGWAQSDVGPFGGNNASISYDAGAGTYTISSQNALLGSTSPDYFRITYQVLNGDGSITAKVDSLSSTSSSARAGIMLRDTLDNNSKYVTAELTTSQARSDGRTTTGSSGSVTTATGSVPMWLRITRTGTSVVTAKSSDGVGWTTIATRTVTMGTSVFVGMFVNSTSSNTVATATFSNVQLTGATGPVTPTYNALPTPTNVLVTTPAVGTGLNISWDDVAGESGYLVERSSDGVTYTTAGTMGVNVTTLTDPNLAGSLRYFYRVSALGPNSTRSAPSAVVSAINRPSAVTNLKFMSLNTTQVVIDWRDTDNETGYPVERSPDGNVWTTLTTTAANIPSYNATALTQGTTYQFRITPTSALGDGPSTTISTQTRLNAVTGVAFSSVQSNQVKLSWTGGVPFATNYRIERSTNNSTWTALSSTVPSTATTYTDATVTPLGKYYYRVVAINALTESTSATTIKAATPSATPLPTGWTSLDIGSVSPGASGFSGATASVIGGGSVLTGTGTGDSFQFLFQRTTGDGDFVARVASIETTSTVFGGGVMLRSTFAANSNYVALRITPSGVSMLTRGGTVSASTVDVDAPIWLKLTRSGTTVTGYYSANGVDWTLVGTSTGAIATGNAFVGLHTTPQDSITLVKATFDSLSGSMLNQPDTTAPSTPILNTISTDSGPSNIDRVTNDNTLTISGNAEAGSLVTITRSDVGVVGSVQANYQGLFTFDYTGTTLADGDYTFTAVAKDASNNPSATSAAFNVTIDTAAPTPIAWNFNPTTQLLEVTYAEGLQSATVQTADLSFANLTTPSSPSTSSAAYNAATRTATYGIGLSLVDGQWRATLNSGAVSDTAGNASAGPFTFEFYYAAGTGGADTYTVRRSTPGGAFIDFIENGVTTTVPRANLRQIVLNPLGGSDAVHLDSSNGDWMPSGGITIGATESVKVTGGVGQGDITFSGNVLGYGNGTVDMTSVQSLTLASAGFVLQSDLAGRSLTAADGAAVDVQSDLILASLSVSGGATMNLNTNDMIVRGGDAATIDALVGAGSLVSDEADANTTIAVAPAAILGIEGSQTALFAGRTVTASDVIVKYTYVGDANLDGVVTGDDYSSIDFAVLIPGATGWWNGDFNHDGVITGDDYSAIDFAILLQGPPL
jgi:regulation of enolase protein 1 (concanavalin A-like superfamily)